MKEIEFQKLVNEIDISLQNCRLFINSRKDPKFDFIFKYPLSNQICSQNCPSTQDLSQNSLIKENQQGISNISTQQNESYEENIKYDNKTIVANIQLELLSLPTIQNIQQQKTILKNKDEEVDCLNDSNRYIFKRKNPIVSISEAQEKEEEEDTFKDILSKKHSGQLNFYSTFRKEVYDEDIRSSNSIPDRLRRSEVPSPIHSEKGASSIHHQNDFSYDIDLTLDFLNDQEETRDKFITQCQWNSTEDYQCNKKSKYSNQNNNNSNYSQNNKKQISKFQSTASESLFDDEEASIHLSARQNLPNKKQQEILSANQNGCQQPVISNIASVSTQQSQPYLLQIESLNDSANDSLLSYQNEESSVFEALQIQNSYLNNFLGSNNNQSQTQQQYIPVDVNYPVFAPNVQYCQQDNLNNILSPLFSPVNMSNQYINISQDNIIQQNHFQNIHQDNFQINNYQQINCEQISYQNNSFDIDTKMEMLEKELLQLNDKIPCHQQSKQVSLNSPQVNTTKLNSTQSHSRHKSSLINTEESFSPYMLSRKNSITIEVSYQTKHRQSRIKQNLETTYKINNSKTIQQQKQKQKQEQEKQNFGQIILFSQTQEKQKTLTKKQSNDTQFDKQHSQKRHSLQVRSSIHQKLTSKAKTQCLKNKIDKINQRKSIPKIVNKQILVDYNEQNYQKEDLKHSIELITMYALFDIQKPNDILKYQFNYYLLKRRHRITNNRFTGNRKNQKCNRFIQLEFTNIERQQPNRYTVIIQIGHQIENIFYFYKINRFNKAQAIQSIEFLDSIKETIEFTQQQYEAYIFKTVLPVKGYDQSLKQVKAIQNKQIQQEILTKLKKEEQVNGRRHHNMNTKEQTQQKATQQIPQNQNISSQLTSGQLNQSEKEQLIQENERIQQKANRLNNSNNLPLQKNYQKQIKIAVLCTIALFLIFIQKKFNISSRLVAVLKMLLGLQ